MSYSFSVRGSSADEVQTKVRDELVKVVAQQPVHKLDCDQAHAAAQSLLSLLRTPSDTEDVCASVSGSVWAKELDGKAESVSLNISAGFASKT